MTIKEPQKSKNEHGSRGAVKNTYKKNISEFAPTEIPKAL
jgi:hypothetical protein